MIYDTVRLIKFNDALLYSIYLNPPPKLKDIRAVYIIIDSSFLCFKGGLKMHRKCIL